MWIVEFRQMNNELSKRVLAIHDLSGWGHTSLMAVIPILYRLGVRVAALPGCVLSTNTDYPDYVLDDQTKQMRRTLKHWEALGQRFDAVYTGFLGSPEQVELLVQAIPSLLKPAGIILVDPVMGDGESLYSCYDTRIVPPMREMISIADIITPNLFEARALAQCESHTRTNEAALEELCGILQGLGAKNVVITSAEAGDSEICAVAVKTTDGAFSLRVRDRIPTAYNGTGDVFASIMLGLVLKGFSLVKAVDRAMQAVAEGVRLSLEMPVDHRDGVHLERLLNSADFARICEDN